MKLSYKIIWLFLALLPAQAGFAQAKKLLLEEAIFLSLRYNPNVQNGEIQRVVDKFNLRVAENEFEWQYALNASYQKNEATTAGVHSRSESSTFTPAATLNGVYGTTYSLTMTNPTTNGIYNPGINATITQPFLRGFGMAVTLAPLYNAYDNEKQSRLLLKSTVIQDVVNVIQAYRAVILAQNNLKTSELALKAYQSTIDADNARIRSGQKAPVDVLEAQAQYATEEVNYQNAKNAVLTTKLQLLNQIGLPPETEIIIPADIEEIVPLEPTVNDSFKVTLENNTQYLSDLLGINILKRQLLVATDANRPSLDFTLDATTGNGSGTGFNSGLDSLINGKNTNVIGMFNLQVPIDNYPLKQQIINSQISLSKAEISLQAEVRQLKTTIINNINDVVSNLKQIQLAENALKLREKDQEKLNVRLKYGLVSTFEVTTKQRELNDARQRLITAKVQYLNSLTVLYANMGIILDEWKINIIY